MHWANLRNAPSSHEILTALRGGRFCPMVSAALWGNMPEPGAPVWQKEVMCPHPTVKVWSAHGEQGVQLPQVGKKTSLALPGNLVHWDPKANDHPSNLFVAIAKVLVPISSKSLLVPPAICPQRAQWPLCAPVTSLLHSQKGRGANAPSHWPML